MEIDQNNKRLEWLDGERKKAEQSIVQLERRVELLESALSTNQELTNTYKKQMARMQTAVDRIADFSKEIQNTKTELERELKANEDKDKERQSNFELKLLSEQQRIDKAGESLRKELAEVDELRSDHKSQEMELKYLAERIENAERLVNDVNQAEENRQALVHSIEVLRKQDAKAIAEVQGEISSIVDLSENAVSRVEKLADDNRRLRNKFEDVERKVGKYQETLQEKSKQLASEQLKRENLWADWQERFEKIEKQSDEVGARLKDIETIELAVKRAQGSFDELTEKITRRLNELSEVQRLGEQRFRQEWSTFQSDAQKRWTGFVLGQEESQKKANRQSDRLGVQVSRLEDELTDLRELSQHLNDQTESLLQNLTEALQESLSRGESFFNSSQ